MTGWILCVINHIREDVFKNAQSKHHIQVNNVIKIVLMDQLKNSYMKVLIRSRANIKFSIKRIIILTVMNLSGIVKIISNVNIHLWHKKYSLPSTKVLGFVACMVTSKMLGIGSAERSWGDVKTIKPGKISDLGSDISEKQSILYTSICIEEERIGRTLSHKDSKNS